MILAFAVAVQAADSYRIDWSCISSGGGVASGAVYRLNATVGQPAAGFASNSERLHWIGFWSGDVPTPTVCATMAAAKLLPDGAFVSVAGKVATSAAGDFAGYFYIEEAKRTSGIRVDAPALAELARGSVANVIGTMGTTLAGERQIEGPMVIITSSTTPLAPLGMTNKALGGKSLGSPPDGQVGVTGGTGLNNVGLLVCVWGLVTASGDGYVDIDDGSGPVRVDTSALASQPEYGDYVSVIGISSVYKRTGETLRLVLPRGDADVL